VVKILKPLLEKEKKTYDIRVVVVTPGTLEHDVMWKRIQARDESYALNCTTTGHDECYKIFKTSFFNDCKRFLRTIQQVPNVVVTDLFWAPTQTEWSPFIEKLVADVETIAQPLVQLHLALDSGADDGPLGGGGGGGGGGVGSWAAADVVGTNLHMTIVPPPSLAHNEDERRAVLSKLRAKDGAKVRIRATKYHIAESRDNGETALPTSARRGAAPSTSRKRVCFWEVDSVEGLEDNEQLPSQRRCYHITDLGSLGPSSKPALAFEVMERIVGGGFAADADISASTNASASLLAVEPASGTTTVAASDAGGSAAALPLPPSGSPPLSTGLTEPLSKATLSELARGGGGSAGGCPGGAVAVEWGISSHETKNPMQFEARVCFY